MVIQKGLQGFIDNNICPKYLYQVIQNISPNPCLDEIKLFFARINNKLVNEKIPRGNLGLFPNEPFSSPIALTKFEVYTVYPQLDIAELNFLAELSFLAQDNLKLPNGNNLLHTLLDNFSIIEKKGIGTDEQQYDFLKITLDTKIDVNEKDQQNRTAFAHFLDVMNLFQCCPNNFRLFIEAGENANTTNSQGLTGLHILYDHKIRKELGYLTAYGMDPNIIHPRHKCSVSQLLANRNESRLYPI